MADVAARPTWEQQVRSHAVLGIVALSVGLFAAAVLRSMAFRSVLMPFTNRLLQIVAHIILLGFIVGSFVVATISTSNMQLPHLQTAHSVLGVVVLALIVANVLFNLVRQFTERRLGRKRLDPIIKNGINTLSRSAILLTGGATIITGLKSHAVQSDTIQLATIALTVVWGTSLLAFAFSDRILFPANATHVPLKDGTKEEKRFQASDQLFSLIAGAFTLRRAPRGSTGTFSSDGSTSSQSSDTFRSSFFASTFRKFSRSTHPAPTERPAAPLTDKDKTDIGKRRFLLLPASLSLAAAIPLLILASQVTVPLAPEPQTVISIRLANVNATAPSGAPVGSLHAFCQAFRLPDNELHHVIDISTVFDASSPFVLLSLYATQTAAPSSSAVRCDRVLSSENYQLLSTCARGQSPDECRVTFPREAGVLMSSNFGDAERLKFLYLQVQYAHMGASTLMTEDHVGFDLAITRALRPYDVGVMSIGALPSELVIPRGESSVAVERMCSPPFTDGYIVHPLNILAYGFAGFNYARSLRLASDRIDGAIFANDAFSSTDPQSYKLHVISPEDRQASRAAFEIQQGETVRVTCTYDTTAVEGFDLTGGNDPSSSEACAVRIMYFPVAPSTPVFCGEVLSFDLIEGIDPPRLFSFGWVFEPLMTMAGFFGWYVLFWLINLVLVRVSPAYVGLGIEKKRLVLGYIIELFIQASFLLLYLYLAVRMWIFGDFIGEYLDMLLLVAYYTVIMYICELVVRCDISGSVVAHHVATVALFLIAAYPVDMHTPVVWEYCILMIIFVYVEIPSFFALAVYRLSDDLTFVRRSFAVALVTYVISRALNDVWAIALLILHGKEMGIMVAPLAVFTALIVYAQVFSFMAQYGIYKRVLSAERKRGRAGEMPRGPHGGRMSRGASAAEVVEGAIQAARVHKERSWLEQELSNTQGMLQTGDNDPQRVEQLKGDIAFITRSLHKIELSAQLQELETTEEARGDEVEMSEMATSSQAEMTASPKEGLRVDLSEAIKDAGSPMLSPIRAQAASFTLDADSPMVGDFISTI